MRRLSSQIFAGQLVILAVTVLVGFLLFAHEERRHLDTQYEQRAAAIARTVAGMPEIAQCLETRQPGCDRLVQQRATQVESEAGAAYVVVIDLNRVRHSHPNPALVGQQVEEPIATLDGRTHVGIDNGSLGRSANGKAPLYAADGRMVGEVSVGIEQSSISGALWRELPAYAGWFAVALAVGAVASWALARRLKRRTFGLELHEIVQLLQEREATLHGIREGVIAFDPAGRVTAVNDEARRLLDLGHAPIGGRLEDVVPAGRLRDLLSGEIPGKDAVVLTDDRCLTVNRMPVLLARQPHGAVVTLRDRTEMAGLLRELDGVRSLTDALRAQRHEFSNWLHTVIGLLELGRPDEALRYLTELRGSSSELAEDLSAQIACAQIVGLLLGKAAEAHERGIVLEISPETWLGEPPEKVQALTTIVGNLIDNAMDAVGGADRSGRITVELIDNEDAIDVSVVDNGPGIPAGAAELIFTDGFTTKPSNGSLHRGLGLALVHRLVQRLGGEITVSQGPGRTSGSGCPRRPARPPSPMPLVPGGDGDDRRPDPHPGRRRRLPRRRDPCRLRRQGRRVRADRFGAHRRGGGRGGRGAAAGPGPAGHLPARRRRPGRGAHAHRAARAPGRARHHRGPGRRQRPHRHAARCGALPGQAVRLRRPQRPAGVLPPAADADRRAWPTRPSRRTWTPCSPCSAGRRRPRPPRRRATRRPTLELIRDAVKAADGDISASEVASQVGISRATAARYLTYLTRHGILRLQLRYGGTGRPEHRYSIDRPGAR